MLVFQERGKPEKNLLEQSKEPTTNLTHIWPWVQNQTRAITTTCHSCPISSSGGSDGSSGIVSGTHAPFQPIRANDKTKAKEK